MPLIPLAPGLHYFASPVNTLVVEDGAGGALIVDTGLDDAHARKLLRVLAEHRLTPTAILNTHSHADHHGGNAFVLKKYPRLPVYAPPFEAAIIRQPLLKPLTLYGACPPPALCNKFLLARASPAQPLPSGRQRLAGVEVELLDIPGHAVEMYAVRVGDVLFAADGLFGQASLSKHPLTFCVDSAAQKASATKLGELDGVRTVLPAHGQPTDRLTELAELNVSHFRRITETILKAVRDRPMGIDDLLARVCDALRIQMTNAGTVVLNRAVVSAHLTELVTGGELVGEVRDNHWIFAGMSEWVQHDPEC